VALRVAILGSGNIGTDPMVKVRRTPALRLVAVVGIDPASDGLARARALGVPASDAGLERWLATDPDVDVVMEATSARAHAAHAPLLAARGIRCIDLTPAALGPPVVPDAGLDRRLDAADVSLVTCGAQATVPLVAALSAVDPRDLIVAVGRAQAVSGQEDLLIEIAARAAGRSEAAG
jgi:acetaldehyde dehydrogenase